MNEILWINYLISNIFSQRQRCEEGRNPSFMMPASNGSDQGKQHIKLMALHYSASLLSAIELCCAVQASQAIEY